MKDTFTKITSFLLAFLVLLSTFSFTVESHYCGEVLIDSSLTGHAEVCKSDLKADLSIEMKDCCSDEVHKIEGQDELQHLKFDDLDFSKQQFITSFLTSYQNLFLEKKSEKEFYNDISPPDIPLNYQVIYQSFLI